LVSISARIRSTSWGHDERGTIALRQKWSRGQVEARFANMPPCLIGMEACVGAYHPSRKLNGLGHDARLIVNKRRKMTLHCEVDQQHSVPIGVGSPRRLTIHSRSSESGATSQVSFSTISERSGHSASRAIEPGL
jgi:hypothetical protein